MRTVGTLPVLMVAVFGSAPANAQQRDGAEARMAQRVEFGFSRNHRGDDTLPAVTYRLTGALDRDRFLTVEGGVLATPNPAFDAGLRVRLPAGRRMAALLSAGSGLLMEDGYVGLLGGYRSNRATHAPRSAATAITAAPAAITIGKIVPGPNRKTAAASANTPPLAKAVHPRHSDSGNALLAINEAAATTAAIAAIPVPEFRNHPPLSMVGRADCAAVRNKTACAAANATAPARK
jgi:hypothetical protein